MDRVQTYQEACFLACESREAVVLFDDLTDRLQDNPTFIQELGLEQQEVDRIQNGLRRITDRSFDFMNRLARGLAQDIPQPVLQPDITEGSQGKKPAGDSGTEGANTSPASAAKAAVEEPFTLDESWRVAEASHAHAPAVFESVLLPKPETDSQEVSVEAHEEK